MMQKNPLHALILIDQLDLHSSIFTCVVDPPRHDALRCGLILQDVLNRVEEDDNERLWFAAATSPFRDQTIKGKQEVSAVSIALRDGLKVCNSKWSNADDSSLIQL